LLPPLADPPFHGFGLATGGCDKNAKDNSNWLMVGGGVAGAIAAGPFGLAFGAWAARRWGKKRYADHTGGAY